MKTIISLMRIPLNKIVWGVALSLFLLTPSCLDEPEDIRTVQEDMMGEFLEKRPEQFSEFARLLDTTEVLGLVNAYGEYTMFAPTNEAMMTYYQEKGLTSLADFDVDSLRKIAYDHLIKGYEVPTNEFLDGLLPFLTMSDRYVSTTSKTEANSLVYYVNENSRIIGRNNIVKNGIVHVVDRVLDPSTLNIIQAVADDERFSLFMSALIETGLSAKLGKTRDDS